MYTRMSIFSGFKKNPIEGPNLMIFLLEKALHESNNFDSRDRLINLRQNINPKVNHDHEVMNERIFVI